MVEVDDVDRVDRGVGVGIGGEQHAPGRRVDVHRGFEELDAAHLRHPVVGDEHRDRLAAQLQLVQGFQRVGARLGAHDAELLAVVPTKVAGYGTGHRGVVVDGEDHRFAGLVLRSSHRLKYAPRVQRKSRSGWSVNGTLPRRVGAA